MLPELPIDCAYWIEHNFCLTEQADVITPVWQVLAGSRRPPIRPLVFPGHVQQQGCRNVHLSPSFWRSLHAQTAKITAFKSFFSGRKKYIQPEGTSGFFDEFQLIA
jgi:hypothetical protein